MGGQRTTPRSPRGVRTRERNHTANGLGHTQIAQIQRARILSATFDVVAERGAGGVSVAHVVERSGVSRRTFYELFENREHCFLAAFEDALLLARGRMLTAYGSERKWKDRIRASLVALLGFLDEEPTVGRLLICESLAGGPKMLVRRAEVLDRLTRVLDDSCNETVSAASPPSLTAEGLVGAVLSLLHTRLAQSEHEPLLPLTNPLMSMIALPYLGQAAARRELERPVPSPVPFPSTEVESERLLSDPLKEVGMRLTYRTIRVLLASAECPGASNRTIGEIAGIADQGQISKLLSRLRRLGLISNTGLGPGLGAPNAWALTATGRQLTKSVQAHTKSPR